jgi:hypothetical protein
MSFTIKFAGGLTYTLCPMDVELLKDSGLSKILTEDNVYIPRYGITFPAFMHFVYGYSLTVSYIRRISGKIPSAEFLEMMLIDNRIYQIKGIRLIIVSLLYKIAPKLLDKDAIMVAFSHEEEHVKEKHRDVVKKIRELEVEIGEQKPKFVFEWMPLDKLKSIHTRLVNKLDYCKFKENMQIRLPYIFIGLIELISHHTERKLSENYKKNIKTRLREDEDIILELYTLMKKTGITYTSQTILSVLTNLFIA